jgi:hypothetical protein
MQMRLLFENLNITVTTYRAVHFHFPYIFVWNLNSENLNLSTDPVHEHTFLRQYKDRGSPYS